MMKVALIIGFLFSLPFVCLPQEKLQHGWILTDSGDTIHLLIDDQGDIQNALKIRTLTLWDPPEEKVYYADRIKAYSIWPDKHYEGMEIEGRFLFLRTMVSGTIDVLVLREFTKKETVFLRKGGRVVLLYSVDRSFPVSKTGGHHEIFLLKQKIDHCLDSVFSDCDKIRRSIPYTPFKLTDLSRLVKNYNECSGKLHFVDARLYSNQPITSISFFAGGILSRVEIHKEGLTYFEQSEFINRPGIRAGLSLDLHYRTWTSGLILQFLCVYQQKGMKTIKGNTYQKVVGLPPVPLDIEFNLNYLDIGIAMRYRWSEKCISPYLSVGLSGGYLLNAFDKAFYARENDQKASYIFNEENESPAEAGFQLQFGLICKINPKQQLFAGLSYENTAHMGITKTKFTNRSGGLNVGITF